jgi:leader peptidase (prepilin peptidase) / N-methyltransferase
VVRENTARRRWERILKRRAAVAAAAATAVCACIVRFGPTAELIVPAFASAVLVVLAAIDIDRRLVPNRIVLPAAAATLAIQAAVAPESAPAAVVAAVGAAGVLLTLALAYPAGMGMGDVKLTLLLGAALEERVLAALLIGAFAATVWGIWLLWTLGRPALKKPIPLVPFLGGAAIAILLLGG